jgi:glutamine amidotransferase-like uncharacterized protein
MFEWMGYTVTRLDADTINQSEISHIDVVYFPGGSSGPYREGISAEGREKIRRLVHSGGCFIGTCAGALFAAEQVVWEGETDPRPTLGLFPGTVEGPLPEIYTDPEYGMCQVNLEPHPITAAEPDSAWILYYNGPFFSPNPDAEVDIVGRYEITNDPALVAFEYGRGRVFLTGPHPEWEEDDGRDGVSYFDRFSDQGSDWDLMLGATRWCLRGIDTLTLTATSTPAPTPMLTATPTPLPTSVLLEPMNHQAQTRNNCGPTSVAIALGYYDQWVTQQEVRTWFYYPLSSDGGLGWCPIPWCITRYGLMAHAYRFPSTRDRDRKLRPVRVLLANDIPVIVMQRLSVDRNIGHYRVIQGYDDAATEFISDDPLLGPDYRIPYDTFVLLAPEGLFPVYPPEMDAQVQSLMKEAGAYHWTNEDGLTCAKWGQP